MPDLVSNLMHILCFQLVYAQVDLVNVNIKGVGATFPDVVYQLWANLYPVSAIQRSRNVSMTFLAQGSGAGRTSIINKNSDYGASDGNASSTEWTNNPTMRFLPVLAGACAIGYNIPGLDSTNARKSLNMSRPNMVGIWNGTITTWSDPLILNDNPFLAGVLNGASYPITTIKRSDSSGTTQIFTSALSSFSAAWNSQYKTFQTSANYNASNPSAGGWPVIANQFTGAGNPGVAVGILTRSYSIGYLEQQVAIDYNVPVVAMINKAGFYVKPTIVGVKSAVEDAKASYDITNKKKFLVNIVDGSSPDTYPISGFTYVVFHVDWPATEKMYELFRYFHWMITDTSAITSANSNTFVTLTPTMEKIAFEIMSEVKGTKEGVTMIDQILQDYAQEVIIRNTPRCSSCVRGKCVAQNVCVCDKTWTGSDCSVRDLPTLSPTIWGQVEFIAISSINIICMLLLSVTGFGLYRYRMVASIRSSSNDINYVLLWFLMLGHGTLFLRMGVPNDSICTARVFLIPLTWTGILTSIVLKLWRVYFVFGASNSVAKNNAIVGKNYMYMYLFIASVVSTAVSGLWSILSSFKQQLLTDVDDYYFYNVCASQVALPEILGIVIFALYFFLALLFSLFLGFQLKIVPKKFRLVSSVSENMYLIALVLIGLLINEKLRQSEYNKMIVFCVLAMFSFQFIHFSILGRLVWKAHNTDRTTSGKGANQSSSVLGSTIENANTSSAAINNANNNTSNAKKVLECECVRLKSGFLSHWEKETLTFDESSGLLIFESKLLPGNFTVFSTRQSTTKFLAPPGFETSNKLLEFTIVHYSKNHLVVLGIGPEHREFKNWIRIIKSASTQANVGLLGTRNDKVPAS